MDLGIVRDFDSELTVTIFVSYSICVEQSRSGECSCNLCVL